MDQSILEPVRSYFDVFRDKHKQLAESYFDELVARSGVSAEKNAALVAERNKKVSEMNAADARTHRYGALRVLLIVLSVLAVLAGAVVCVMTSESKLWVGLLTLGLGLAFAASMVTVVCLVLNKHIKQSSAVADDLKKQAAALEKKAWKQMQPLNALYDWHIPDGLIYRTVPQIQLDKYFDEDKLAYFDRHCTLGVYGKDSSAVCVKSGNSSGRPFLYTRFLRQSMVPYTYTGTRVVTWTEHETDSEGHSRTVTRSETLIASVVKPKPDYKYHTYLFYGCDAASELHFSRAPTVPRDADDKKIASLVRRGERALEKKSRQAVSEGGSYNKLANSEFEVLFGAEDRDNELQFRMMFTPLAQQNMVQLLRSREPYGDDFYFDKIGAVNVIQSEHSARLAIDADPARFAHFDLAAARKNFVDYNCEYFGSLYFDFAPLFSVPLYTQDAPAEQFGECTKIGNIGEWEAEAVANYLDSGLLAHPASSTMAILKAQTSVGEQSTVAHVTAHSFEAVPQVDYIPTLCRNGHTYEVPVTWMLYLPLEQTTDIEMQACDISREAFDRSNRDHSVFVAGIKAKITH